MPKSCHGAQSRTSGWQYASNLKMHITLYVDFSPFFSLDLHVVHEIVVGWFDLIQAYRFISFLSLVVYLMLYLCGLKFFV